MDNSKSRKSDAAATRKRRSSILKSQRAPRAPFSELEFNVATPQDQAKSRRVSFSRRTGVAEFEINEATTAWKNVYEEHNKSLETSANSSGGARPRRVAHLGARRADLFPDAELADLGLPEPPRPKLDLAELTAQDTVQLFCVDTDTTRKDLTDGLDVDFSAVAPLADVDDLDILQNDLQTERRANMSEYNIDVDFNSTHFTLKADESDDMSITDSVHSPRVTAAKDEKLDDWTVDKENVVVNPYVAPPPADFADHDCDDVLVFDGKKCKFQSNLDSSDELSTGRKGRIVYNTANVSVTKAPEQETISDMNRSRGLSEREAKTVLFDDTADMTVTQAVPAQILQPETRHKTIVYDDDDADISVTQAVPVNIISPIHVACDDDVAEPEKAEKQKTMFFDASADISVTQAVPANIIQERINDVATVAPPTAGRRKTVVFGNDDGDLSITGALPANILDKQAELQPTERRRTIVYSNDDADVSMTGVVPADIMIHKEGKPVQTGAESRKTIVYGEDEDHVSMTGVVPANIVVTTNEANPVPTETTGRRKTIVYSTDDGDVSMTGVLPANIIVDAKEDKLAPPAGTERRKTIVYGNDDGNISMTGVVPAHVMVEATLAQADTDRRKTIVYNNDDGNISMTGVVPPNIMLANNSAKDQTANAGRRKTILYGNDDGNISMTGVVPPNIMLANDSAKDQTANAGRRKTIVYGNDDGNISMTGVVSANVIIDREANETQPPNRERRKTVVFGDDDGNISVTGVVPTNIIYKDAVNTTLPVPERRQTIDLEYDNADGTVAGVVPANVMMHRSAANQTLPIKTECNETATTENVVGNISLKGVGLTDIMTDKDGAQTRSISSERRKTVDIKSDIGNVSIKEFAPTNITMDKSGVSLTVPVMPERRKTVVFGNDDGDISVTGVVPANILVAGDGANENAYTNSERRKTVVFDHEDGNISMTGVVPAYVMDKDHATQTEPIIIASKETVMSQNEVINFYKTKDVPDNMDGDQNLTVTNTGEHRNTVVFENDDGNLSATRVVETKGQAKTNTTLLTNTDGRKSVYENEDCDISMTEVVPAGVIVDESKANVTLPHTERTETVVCESEEVNVSMTDVVPDSIVEDKTKLNQTANDRRKSVVTDNTSMSMAWEGLSHEKEVEIIDRSNRKTIVYEDMEGDVSMTEAAATGLEIHSKTISQAIEPEIIDNKDKNDQVALNEVETSFIELEQSSTQTAAGRSRHSLPRDTRDATQMRNVSTLQKSLADGVLVYDTSVCDDGQQTEACDSNALLRQYIQEASDRRRASLRDSSDHVIQGLARDSDSSVIGTSGTSKVALDIRCQSLLSDTSMPNIVEPDRSSHSHSFYPILVEDRKSMIDRLSHNSSRIRDDFSKSSPPDSKVDPESQNPKPVASELDVSENSSSPERVSWLVGTSHGASALDALSRSLAPNRVSILQELSPEAFKNTGKTSPSSVLDALLDMSSMDGELLDAPPGEPHTNISTNTVSIMNNAPVEPAESRITTRADDKVTSDEESEKSYKDEILSTTRPEDDGEAVGEQQRRFSQHHVTFDERCAAADVSVQAQWDASATRATQAGGVDDTGDILDALSAFTQTRRSGDFDDPGAERGPRRSGVPDRKSMVRSREDLLNAISMAQELIKTEMEQSESEEEASPRRGVVKTLHFDDDSLHESPRDVHKPAEQRRSHPIPYYLQNVSDNVKELIDDLIKPMADVSTFNEYAPRRESSAQTDRQASQINLVTSSTRLPSPPTTDVGVPKSSPRQDVRPRRELQRASPPAAVVFDPRHPLRNVRLPAAAREPHRYAPREPRPSAASLSPCPSLDARETQTDRQQSQHQLQCQVALVTASPMNTQDPPAGSDGDLRKRSHVPADPSREEVTPRPAVKVQKVSSSVKLSRRSRSPTVSEPTTRSASPETIPLVSDTLSVTSQGLESVTSQRSRDAVNVVSKIDMLPFMGTWECQWECRSADTWSFLLLRGRLRLLLRLQHNTHDTRDTHVVRADTPVTHAELTRNEEHESSEPVLRAALELVSASLRVPVSAARRAGAARALLRRCVLQARAAARWTAAMRHARLALAYSLPGPALLQLKVANVPMRCVWLVSLRLELEQCAGAAWPRAADVTVAPLRAHWSPAPAQLRRLLAPVPEDWGHVPRTLWKVFKYLKNKRPEDDLVLGA